MGERGWRSNWWFNQWYQSNDFPGGSDGKASAYNAGDPGFNPWVGKSLWRRKWQPTPVFLLGKSPRRRSLVGYSPWGCKESDTTEQLHFHSFTTVMKPHKNPKAWCRWSVWGGEHWRSGESGHMVWRLLDLSHPPPCANFPSGCSQVILFNNKPVNLVGKMFLWALWDDLAN